MAETLEMKFLQRLKDLHTAGRFFANRLDQRGLCHIHHAVFRGYLHCVKWLIKHGSSLTVRSAEGSVPAHYAAAGGHLECLKWIHKRTSKSISMTDYNGAIPLYFAAQEGHLSCLVWLAKHSGTVHSQVSADGTTAAHVAAQEGHLECLIFLLSSAGCSGLARDKIANSPLHYAAASGRRSCVEWLLSNIGSLRNERNKVGSSPLHVAAQNGHLEVVKSLLKGGAAIHLRDRLGRTPYHVAVESGNEACAAFLHQAETKSREIYSAMRSAISGDQSLKRVRFERKAIDKDTEPRAPTRHSDVERGKITRNHHSLYKNSTDNAVLLNRPDSLLIRDNYGYSRPRPPYLTSQGDRRYTPQPPQDFDTSVADLQMKTHVSNSGLLPWSRVYRMTSSADHMASRYQPNIFSSQENGRKVAERRTTSSQNYTITTYEQPSPVSRNSSLVSRVFLRRKNKELFPADIDHFDDIFDNNTHEHNVFKRFYKFSKRKLTRSSSFAIEGVQERTDSFVVTGQDEFLSGSVNYRSTDPHSLDLPKHGDKMSLGNDSAKTPSKEAYQGKDEHSEKGANITEGENQAGKTKRDKKMRRRTANEGQSSGISRENALIW